MVKQVEGIAIPEFTTEEIHKCWVMFAVVLIAFLIFEALVFYYIYYGKKPQPKNEGGSPQSRAIEMKVSSSPSSSAPNGEPIVVTDTDPERGIALEPETIEKDTTTTSIMHEQVHVRTDTESESSKQYKDLLPRRMDAIEGLRIIGAIHIVLFHFYTFENQKNMCLPCKLGHYWVHIYFMITGLVSYKSCSRTDTPYGGLRLLERRLKTLYPMVFFSCLLTYIGKVSADIYVTSITTQRVLFLVSTFTPPFAEAGTLNGPSWFIGTLTLYWIALPHWCCAAKRASGRGLALMLIVLYLSSYTPHLTWYGILGIEFENEGKGLHALGGMITFSPYTNWWHVPFGVCLAAVLDRFKVGKVRDFIERCGATLGLIGLTVFISLYKQKHRDYPDLYRFLINGPFSYPLLVFLLVGCTQLKDPSTKVLKVVGRWGKYALPLYLLHMPINDFLRSAGDCPVTCVHNKGEYYDFVLLPLCLIVGTYIGAVLQDKWNLYITPKKK